ncbi:MAG: hypothetical protein ACPL07_03115, partial [Candidatus Bathyarchaeia archaeon]
MAGSEAPSRTKNSSFSRGIVQIQHYTETTVDIIQSLQQKCIIEQDPLSESNRKGVQVLGMTKEELSYWFASASLLVNAVLIVFYIPVPLYYLEHGVMLPLDLARILPPYIGPVASSAVFLASVFLSCRNKNAGSPARRRALALLVLSWALPEGYRYLAPVLLLLATLYLCAGGLGRLWRNFIKLASIPSILVLSLSLISMLSPPLKVFFQCAVGLNVSPAATYPVMTVACFVMAPLSLLYLILKRPPTLS